MSIKKEVIHHQTCKKEMQDLLWTFICYLLLSDQGIPMPTKSCTFKTLTPMKKIPVKTIQ